MMLPFALRAFFPFFFFFFFNDTATTEIYTLSLHDALPIWLYLSCECFCTVLASSSSSSCFSQQKHRKPVRRCAALWPRNASNGSITLHHDQYPATVSFKTASTTERKPNIQNPMA